MMIKQIDIHVLYSPGATLLSQGLVGEVGIGQ